MILLAIDPGTSQSGYIALETSNWKVVSFGKVDNAEMRRIVREEYYDVICCEMVASYGRPVGQEVFDTCLQIGRIQQIVYDDSGVELDLVLRRQVKKHILGKASGKEANDSAIRKALIERFGAEYCKEFKADIMAAFSVAVTWTDEYNAPTSP